MVIINGDEVFVKNIQGGALLKSWLILGDAIIADLKENANIEVNHTELITLLNDVSDGEYNLNNIDDLDHTFLQAAKIIIDMNHADNPQKESAIKVMTEFNELVVKHFPEKCNERS